MKVNTLSTDTINKNELLHKCTETAWHAISIHNKADGQEKRREANELGYKAVKQILELLRIGNSEVAIDIGMTAIQMFFDGHNYHQVLSCIEGLRDSFNQSRLSEDITDYEISSENALINPDPRETEGRIDLIYSLIWEKGCLGTSDAIRLYKERTHLTISEPTIVRYCKTLRFERRILSHGGPTGRPYEMFPNNSISLNRGGSYEKVNFFEGALKAKNNLFEQIWDIPHRQNTRVYEIENGNDPRVFALIEPGKSISLNFKGLGGISNMPSKLGVEGTLHPINCMPIFGFKPIKEINDADFLTECKVRPFYLEGPDEPTD